MHDILINLFGSGSFIPHGHCYLWKPGLVWLHLISDAIIGVAYYSIPLTLFYFVRKRQDLPFHWIFLLFAVFIISCGTTHFAEIWTLWYPTYWLSGAIKAGTALVSIYTALELVPLVPKALALPSPAQLEQANLALKGQIEERLRTEAELRQFQNELEARVESRTMELVQVNQQLQQEIEERQCAEAALREQRFLLETILKYAADAIIVCNAEGKLTFANPEARRLAQQDPNDTTLDLDLFNWGTAHDADGKRITLEDYAISKALRGEVSYAIESRMVRDDRSYYDILVSAAPLLNNEQIVGAVASFIDISDRKRAEAEREELLAREKAAREQAEAANRIKDEFLAVLSHELRSPLNPILGWAKLLQSGKLDQEKTKQALATIERNARLQSQLIEDLLDVSRILQGKLVLYPQPIKLVNTIEAAIETVRLAAQVKGIEIQTIFHPDVGKVIGDSARLQQVIWNLLSNAVKFTPSGGKVEIELAQIDNYAQIQVRDTGKGITPEFLPFVFEYFRQEDGSTTRRFGGLGLGLAIVHHLVELHGGTVEAQSPGQELGATFTVRLPLLTDKREQIAGEKNSFASLSLGLYPLQDIRVLLIDDEPDARELIAFILKEAGAIATVVSSASEALKIFPQVKPDLVVSDIGMPEIDGYMLIQKIRAMPPEQGGKVPAIALTAYAGEINQRKAIVAGFQRHLAKPVETNDLIETIITLVPEVRLRSN
ncbi:response regulator [Phormidium sp. LEGE 05292]|uniref:hybrid sensor histidine kinase/response regulator n=1 Tax=[Phormidium] sp. LEGE 05292 TaxID=767427 RepID=UPI0018815B17|nr:PAS domain-containing sensor histidine kinase [Phormidium sp. LEGE 05292]MBE9224446.1 response regulator [Phormidium sp. LEGE 05292]